MTNMTTKAVTRGRLLGTFVLVLGLFIALSASARATTGPKMVIKERFFDFKEAWEGENVEHTFQVENAGDETLKIEDVSTG